MSHKRLLYIDYFRAFAILIIIASHSFIFKEGESSMPAWFYFLFKGGTWFFVWIAGYLFQYLSPKFKTDIFYKKKLSNVILPYLFAIIPVAIIYSLAGQTPGDPLIGCSAIKKFLTCIPFGMLINDPTWFMGMILIMFVVSPLLLVASRSRWFGVIVSGALIVHIMTPIPSFIETVYLQTELPYAIKALHYVEFYFKMFILFLPVYLFGMLSAKFIHSHYAYIKIISKFGLVTSTFVLICLYLLWQHYSISFSLIKLSQIIFMLFGVFWLESSLANLPTINKFLISTANYSFCLFFLHKYVINLFYYHSLWNTYQPPIAPIISPFFIFFLSYLFSVGWVRLVKKFLLYCGINNSRWIVGC